MTATVVPSRDDAASGAADPRVGAVVLTYNRRVEVVRTIERLLALPEQPQIVVADNNSSDGTQAELRRFPTVAHVRLPANIGAAARNTGVKRCDRPYIALCDDDTWWEPGSLRRAADLLETYPRLAIVTGKVLVGADERLDPTCELMARSPLRSPSPLPGPALLGFLAGASMVRRSAFIEAGGFERRFFIGGEEELLAIDLATRGWKIAYVNDVVVHHHPSRIGRDDDGRRRALVRARLWVTWLRRPLPLALARTAGSIRLGYRDPIVRRSLLEAARELPWVMRNRHVVPNAVERELRLLEKCY